MPMIIYECKNAPLYSMTPGLLVFLKLTLREILWLAVFMDTNYPLQTCWNYQKYSLWLMRQNCLDGASGCSTHSPRSLVLLANWHNLTELQTCESLHVHGWEKVQISRCEFQWAFYLPSALSDSVENRMSRIGIRYWRLTTVR